MGSPAIADDTIKIYINNELRSVDPEPFIENGRTYVPIRFIAETFGSQVDWDADQKKVTINQSDKTIQLFINSKQSIVNGNSITLDVTPMIVKGRTVVPLRFIAEALGLDVRWDGNTKSIFISSLNNKPQEGINDGVIFDPLANISRYTIVSRGDDITAIELPENTPHNITVGSIFVLPANPSLSALSADTTLKAVSIVNEGEFIRINCIKPELAEVVAGNNFEGKFDPNDIVVADGVEFEYIPNGSIDDISFMLDHL